MESDHIIAALGPFWNNSGTRTWSPLPAPDGIIAVPYTFFESLQLEDLPRSRPLRRYHVHLLRAIVIQSNSTANTLTFAKLSDETDEYAIALRQETDDYRAVLGELYPGKYQEEDFPTSASGRLLRK